MYPPPPPPSLPPVSQFRRGFPQRPLRSVNPLIYLLPFVAIIFFTFFSSGCERSNLPSSPGDYQLQNNEIRFDGQRYAFRWIDNSRAAHFIETDKVKLVQDDRTFLRVGDGDPTLHMAENQAVQVDGRDNRGNFATPWYPFFWGPIGGGPYVGVPRDVGGNPRSPSYRYPPSDTFGRDETLGGNVPNTKPAPPPYTNIPNAAGTVGGQAGGTGGGAAASGRTDRPAAGQAGGTGSGSAATERSNAPVTGQGGGTGSGSAASSKGGFRSGPSAYSETQSAPANSQPRVGAGGAGSSGSLQSPKAGSGASAAPSKPSTGSKGISGGGGRRR